MKGNGKKKILIGAITILFSLVLFSFTMISNAEEVTVVGTWDVSANDGTSNVTATLYSDGRFVISGTGMMKDYSIFDTLPYDNNKSSVKTVEIQSGVTSIGGYAFYKCTSLSSIEIPEGVTSIEYGAFYGCTSLSSIEIPSSVTSIGSSAFEYCSSLTSIEFPEGVTSIGGYAFYKCTSLSNIVIPSSVTSIENYAFYECSSLISIEIPEGVTSIGDYAFAYCSSLISIEIPEGVTSIGDGAFNGCSSLTSIEVDANNSKYTSKYGVLFDKDKTKLICYPAEKEETEYIIPEGVTSIGGYAFQECTSLSSIEIPSSVTSIGRGAFSGCKSLSNIEIPSSVTSIGDHVFGRCSSLTSIEIPEGVTSIGDSAFDGCSSLTSIEIPEGVTSIGDYAFYGCSRLTSIKIPEGVTSIGDCVFGRCSSLTSIEIPEGVTSIGNGVFYLAKLTIAVATGSENVQELELPEMIKRAMKEEDILYTANDFTLTNCSLSEDKTKLVVDTEVASKNTVSLKVTEGALEGLSVVVVVPSGTITYSTTSWTKDDVTARIYVAEGETIQNNDGKNTYTFTGNGTFTFQYLTAEGEEKQVIATVENIEELAIKNYEVTEQNETKYLEGVKVGATIQEVLNNIETNGTAKVYQEDTKITDENTKVATAMTIKIAWGTADEETYTLVATGDLNGDGEMGDIDLLRLVRYQAGLDTNLNGAYFKAADIYKDGVCADNKDLLKIARVLAGLETL